MSREVIGFEDTTLKTSENVDSDFGVFKRTVRDIPNSFKTRFEKLKHAGKVTGSENAFIVAAIMEKLEKSEQ